MSATGRAFDTLKAVFTYRELTAQLRADMDEQQRSIRALAASHAHLRERVVAIETFLRTAGGHPFSPPQQPRIEG